MISFKRSEIQKYARERERELYSKRMIKLRDVGTTSTFFNMLSVVFIRFSCFVTTSSLFFFHLSSLICSSLFFSSGLKIGHGGLFFHFFHFCGRCIAVFVVKKKRKKTTKGIFTETSIVTRISRVREPVYSHTHTAYIFVICKSEIDVGQNARTSKKSLFVFLVCYKRVIHQYLLEEQDGDEESDAVGHGESRRRCPRWYPRNRHTSTFSLRFDWWMITD